VRAGCIAITLAMFAVLTLPDAQAQAPAGTTNAAAELSDEELETLVSRVALYPDDLIGIILPASTNPLQIVQADRFLAKRKADRRRRSTRAGTTPSSRCSTIPRS
jgi:hypothetical protein